MATKCPRAVKDPDKKRESTTAPRSGQRLNASARRDVRWAMQQVPGESVRDITVHGVRIAFNASANHVQAKAATPNRRGEASQDAQSPERAEKTLNSAQRRNRARAKKHYAELKRATAAMEQDSTSSLPAGPEPLV